MQEKENAEAGNSVERGNRARLIYLRAPEPGTKKARRQNGRRAWS